METPFIERDCVITHNGHTFESGGAYVTEDRAVAYMPNGQTLPSVGELTDWHGNRLGYYTVTSSWPNPRGIMSDRTYAIGATIYGREYYGRTQGAGMVAFLKAYKNEMKGGNA